MGNAVIRKLAISHKMCDLVCQNQSYSLRNFERFIIYFALNIIIKQSFSNITELLQLMQKRRYALLNQRTVGIFGV